MAGTIRIAILADALQARREIRSVSGDLRTLTSDTARATGGFRGLSSQLARSAVGFARTSTVASTAVASIGALSGPVAALGSGLVGAMGAAGIGVGAFTALVVPAFAEVAKGTADATKAAEAYQQALATGDQKQIATALEKQKQALDGLTDTQKRAVSATQEFKAAFVDVSRSFATPALEAYSRGLKGLTKLLPTLVTIARPVQTELVKQFDRLVDSVNSPAFKDFADRLSDYVGPILSSFSQLVADVGMTVGNLVNASLPVAANYLNIFGSLFYELREAAGSNAFVAFLQSTVPLTSSLADLVSALGGTIRALIGNTISLTGPLLAALTGVAKKLTSIFSGDQWGGFVTSIGRVFIAVGPILRTFFDLVVDVAGTLAAVLGPTLVGLTPDLQDVAKQFGALVKELAPLVPVFAEFAADILQAVLPVLRDLAPLVQAFLTPLLFAVGKMPSLGAVIVGVWVAQRVAMVASAAAMGIMRAATVAWTVVQWALNAALLANPIGIIVLAIAALVTVTILAWKNSETFRTVVIAVWSAIKSFFISVWNGVKEAAALAWNFLRNLMVVQANSVKAVWSGVKSFFTGVWNGIKAGASAVWNFIRNLMVAQANAGRAVWNGFKSANIAIWNAIKSAASAVWNAIRGAFTAAKNAITNGLNGIRSVAASVLSRIKALFSPGTLLNAGRQLISGLVSGIRERIGAAVDAVRNGLQRIRDLLPGSPIKDGPLLSWNNGGAGKRLMGLLSAGIAAAGPGVARQLNSVLATVASPTIRPTVSLGDVSGDALLAVSGGATAGSTTYEVTVNAPVGSSPADIGRELVRNIEAFEAAGGRRRAA